MAEAFRVDPEALQAAVEQMGEFQRYAEAIRQEIESMTADLHITWQGRAAAAHAEAHRHWSRGEVMMREALRQLHAAGSTAHANYNGAMTKNLGMWS